MVHLHCNTSLISTSEGCKNLPLVIGHDKLHTKKILKTENLKAVCPYKKKALRGVSRNHVIFCCVFM